MCVRDRALLYYRLLQCGVPETRKVLLGPKSDPSMTIITGRTEEPVNNWASSFNTLDPLLGAESRAQDVPADGAGDVGISDPDQTFHNGTLREGTLDTLRSMFYLILLRLCTNQLEHMTSYLFIYLVSFTLPCFCTVFSINAGFNIVSR